MAKLPILQAAMLCETITTDDEGRPFELVVPVHTIRWPMDVPLTESYRPPNLEVYVCFAEVDHDFLVRAAVTRYENELEIYRSGSIYVSAEKGKLSKVPTEYALRLNNMDISSIGNYTVLVMVNHVAMNTPTDLDRRSDAIITFDVLPPNSTDTTGGVM